MIAVFVRCLPTSSAGSVVTVFSARCFATTSLFAPSLSVHSCSRPTGVVVDLDLISRPERTAFCLKDGRSTSCWAKGLRKAERVVNDSLLIVFAVVRYWDVGDEVPILDYTLDIVLVRRSY